MNDIDDVLRRTFERRSSDDVTRPDPDRLRASVRSGRRRLARRRATTGAAVGAVLAATGAILSLRPAGGRLDGSDPTVTTPPPSASVTIGSSVATSASSASAPTVVAPSSSTVVRPRPVDPGAPAVLVAVADDGRVDVWSADGGVRSVRGCEGPSATEQCVIPAVAVHGGQVWFVEADGTPMRYRLRVGSLAAAEPSRTVREAPVGEAWDQLAIGPDGSVYLATAGSGPLVRVLDDERTVVAPSVTAVAVSGEGRLVYAVPSADGGLGAVVVEGAGGETRRVDLSMVDVSSTSGGRMPEGGSVQALQWSPDGARLLVLANPGEGAVWGSLDLGERPALARLSAKEGVPACWRSAGTVAIGDWTVSYERDQPGPLVEVDAGTGRRVRTLVSSAAEVTGLVCLGDGRTAYVEWPGIEGQPGGGDLVTIDPAGARTIMGSGYRLVVPVTPVASPDPSASASALPNADAFVAVTGQGTLEVWAPRGRVLTVESPGGCAPWPACRRFPSVVSAAVLTDASVWYAGAYDGSIWRAPLDGSTPRLVARVDGWVSEITVTRDDRMAWWVVVREDPDVETALERWSGGVVEAVAADGWSVALSPDERSLAYTTYRTSAVPGPGQLGELVIHDLGSGAERRVPSTPSTGEPPFSLGRLRWSPDGTQLLVSAGWEGEVDLVVDPRVVERLDRRTGGWAGPSCWLPAGRIASAGWLDGMAPESRRTGDLRVGGTGGPDGSYGVDVFADDLACRSDGSVALVDIPPDRSTTGALVVVRPGGVRTVLGLGYERLFAG